VAVDRRVLDEMIKRSKQMPVSAMGIGAELIIGFDENRIKQKLALT
jgi:hypothetical protein